MSLIDHFIAKFAPHSCVGCAREGALLCRQCKQNLAAAPERCYLCSRPSFHGRTCDNCKATTPLLAVRSVAIYDGNAKNIVKLLKFSGAQAAAQEMAGLMGELIKQSLNNDELVIVPVPTATTRVRRRGYDQAKLLARELAWQLKLPYLDCLIRSGQTHQVGSSRAERLSQLESTFRVRKAHLIQSSHIVMVDDVLTTGATLSMAAKTLHEAGAAQLVAVTFAQA